MYKLFTQMKIRLFKYFLCNGKMYFMSMCILTCEMFCLHRSSLSSFHHNTHTFQPFLILYKFLFFLFHFLIINIALSLCYLVADTQVCDVTLASSFLKNGVQPRSSRDNALIPIPHPLNCRDQCYHCPNGNTRGVTLSEKPVANGSHRYAALLVTYSVIAIYYIVGRSESSKFVSGGFYSVNKDLQLYNFSKM